MTVKARGRSPSSLKEKRHAQDRGCPGLGREEAPETADHGDWYLACAACLEFITRPAWAVTMRGKHTHALFNPHGILFEVRCFQQAPGCRVLGPPSLEFTWFAGYAWRLALCSRCSTHLGWRFSREESGFYGLIEPRLIIRRSAPDSEP